MVFRQVGGPLNSAKIDVGDETHWDASLTVIPEIYSGLRRILMTRLRRLVIVFCLRQSVLK